jgi:hypothetical protein
MIGALPAVFVMVGLAVSVISNQYSVNNKNRLLIVYCLLFALFAFNIARTIRHGFILWPQAIETRLNHYQATLLDIVRYEQRQPADVILIADPFFEQIDAESLQRMAGTTIDARWIQAGPGVAGAMIFVDESEYGDGRLYIPEYAPLSPTLIELLQLPASPDDRSHHSPTFAVYPLPTLPEIPLLPEPITFGNVITLEGYELLPHDGGQTVYLVTRWRVNRQLPPHLTVFVHLLNTQEEIVAQHDGLDAAASSLQPGDRLIQLHPLAPPVAGEPFSLQVGLYTPSTGERLSHPGQPADVFTLATDLYFDGK